MVGSTRLWIVSASFLVVTGMTAAHAQTKDSIIWNDPPKTTTAPSTAPSSTAPIRDDYAPPKTLVPPPSASAAPAPPSHAGDQAITWSEPSMPPKDKVGKTNTSAGAAGPCREFQQNVVIDGKRQQAHGTACRQPDGSWRIVN